MVAPLTPIEAWAGEASARGLELVDPKFQFLEKFVSFRRKFVVSCEPAVGLEAVVELDSESAGEMVVTGSRGPETERRVGFEACVWIAGQYV